MFKYWTKGKLSLRYRTGIDVYELKESIRNEFNKYEFIVIDSLMIPMEVGNRYVIEFLKEFCNTMTAGYRVVIFDNEFTIQNLTSTGSRLYFDACMRILDNTLAHAGFDSVSVEHNFLYKDLYIYTKSKLGIDIYNLIDRNYGLIYEKEYETIWQV